MAVPELPPERRPRVALWLLRIVVTIHFAAIVVQPIAAGLYLDGDYDALSVHSLNGSLLPLSCLLLGVATLAYAIAGGAAWPVFAVGALFFAEGLQVGMGYARTLGIHIPLGVGIVVAVVVLTGWAWRPAAARPLRSLR